MSFLVQALVFPVAVYQRPVFVHDEGGLASGRATDHFIN